MTGELFHKLITEKGKKIVYTSGKQESYFYDVNNYIIELYYDWNKDSPRGIRVFRYTKDNTFTILHHLKDHSDLVLCNRLFDLLNNSNNLFNILIHERKT
jgi:hypothetical protein